MPVFYSFTEVKSGKEISFSDLRKIIKDDKDISESRKETLFEDGVYDFLDVIIMMGVNSSKKTGKVTNEELDRHLELYKDTDCSYEYDLSKVYHNYLIDIYSFKSWYQSK